MARLRNPGGPDAADTTKDGIEYDGTTVVAQGSSAPNLLGVFHDKTAIEVDRTGGACDGNVYFSWSRFTGNGGNEIYFVRSTDHGVTFSQPDEADASLTTPVPGHRRHRQRPRLRDLPQFTAQRPVDATREIAKSTDCGRDVLGRRSS